MNLPWLEEAMEKNALDTRIDHSYGDPRLRQAGLNPYQRYPERSSWTEWEVWQRPDGSTYRRERTCSRWGEYFNNGDWETI